MAECVIAGLVPVPIVELFEVIQVEEDHGEETTPFRCPELVFEEDADMPSIREVGQDVSEGQVFDIGALPVKRLGNPSDPN